MIPVRRAILLAATGAAAAGSPLTAQTAERAVFLVRLGRDTLAVEIASYSAGRAP